MQKNRVPPGFKNSDSNQKKSDSNQNPDHVDFFCGRAAQKMDNFDF
jgi:hypothetical protein